MHYSLFCPHIYLVMSANIDTQDTRSSIDQNAALLPSLPSKIKPTIDPTNATLLATKP